MILFNPKSIPILAVAIGVAIGLSKAAGLSGEGPATILAGAASLAADLAWRWRWGGRDWFASEAGGAIFEIPVWAFGVFWMILGVFFMVHGKG
ncbi:hypothetical protein OJF2_39750 [Aquisphaera giovannonii]|uniref:Uncharacterized protein n=1 Tax=Aquisphaera giovannonii TaxID=406548 RepID=A0A5B9W486_9BACT|nr:hypothetical protein [Aquisphaera giovannonii]QEH35423.1 hypothetical protein OJF2_39750 [Aquisphaera giovannonii]